MLPDRLKIDYAKSKLYRQYIVDPINPSNIAGLKTLEDTVYASATGANITLTQTSFEGGSQSGEITFESAILGVAIKELLEKYDPTYLPPIESRVIQPDYTISCP